MATNLQVANRAIREVGGQPIDALDDNRSATSRIVSDALPFSIEEVLSSFDWTINLSSEASTGTVGGLVGSAFNYTHSFSNLAQILDRVVSVFKSDGTQIYEYHIEGQSLYSSEQNLIIRYGFQMTDVATIPAFITSVIAAHLAKEICLPLSGDQDKKAFLEQQYAQQLEKAKITSVLQNPQQAHIDDSTLRHVQKAAAVSSLATEGLQGNNQRRQ